MVPMRDGVRLSTAVILPDDGNGRLPTVLVRTPYPKEFELHYGKWLFGPLLSHGYAIVLQNERGTGWSEGRHRFLAGARSDGYDTISWITSQPWSNGRVGTAGCSSSAEDQLSLAAANHPDHMAMVPMAAGSGIGDIPGVDSQGVFYKGGVPQVGPWAAWYADSGTIHRPKLPAGISHEERVRLSDAFTPYNAPWQHWLSATFGSGSNKAFADPYADLIKKSLTELPSQDILRRISIPETDFNTLIKLSPSDPYWKQIEFIHIGDNPRVPAIHVTSWYDPGAYESIKLFEYLQNVPNQYLIVAPTSHCAMVRANEHTYVGQRMIGDAHYDYAGLFLKWFDYWLKRTNNGVLSHSKVQIFLMGGDGWRTYPSWPPPGSSTMRLFLNSGGRANTRLGDGQLSESQPVGTADSFVSNPLEPVPSRGGGCCGADVVQDQSGVELRNDVLVYSTHTLDKGVTAIGEMRGLFYVSSSAPDCDLTLKLVDVYPDGKAFNLGDTMLRLRYRNGFDKVQLMRGGQIYRIAMKGIVTGNYFGPGHRIRIELAGSNFPNAERNLQTGGLNFSETKAVPATIQIWHDHDHQSFVELTVVKQP